MYFIADEEFAKELSIKKNLPLIKTDDISTIVNTPFEAIFYVEKSDERFYKIDRDIVFKEYNPYGILIKKDIDLSDLVKRFKNGEDIEKELKLKSTDKGIELEDFLYALKISAISLECQNVNKKMLYREVKRKYEQMYNNRR